MNGREYVEYKLDRGSSPDSDNNFGPQNFRFLEELDDEQKEAVLNPGGRTVVIAGPGSGKTRVIIYKIAYLLQTESDPPK